MRPVNRGKAAFVAQALAASTITMLREAQADRAWPPLPPLGLIGEAALREAFEGDFQQLEELLRGELRKLFKMQGDDDPWPWVRAVFEDAVVVERDGKFWRYAYTADGTNVTLATPTEVVQRYLPADGSAVREAVGVFLEAEATAGGRYLVRVIRAGLSGNGNFYPDAALREAVGLFNGTRVFVKSDEEHLKGKGKDVRNLVGRLTEAKFVAGPQVDKGEIQATLELIEPEGDVGAKLREALTRGMGSLFGLSIDAIGPTHTKKLHGRNVRMVEAIQKVASVDLIVEPGAGGEIINLIEAQGDDAMWRKRLIEAIRKSKPSLLSGKQVDELTDEDLEGLLREALGTGPEPDGGENSDAGADLREAMAELSRMNDVREHLREALAESKLPQPARDRIKARFKSLQRFTEADVDSAIAEERTYLAQFTESGTVLDLGEGRIEPGEGRDVKVRQMLDAFFDPANREVRSIRECYIEITGDRRVTGILRECDQSALREALGSDSWADVLGDSIRRRVIADYNVQNQYDIWRRICSVVPVNDFRTNERTRWGGYGDLPTVAERDPYPALDSPTDEKASYAATKRGGTETVTLEMIKNDDVGAVQRVPTKMSRAAKRTLAKFVLDFIRTNPVIYDTKALFHADHGNLGSTALGTAGALAAARLLMSKQTEKDSGDRLGIAPKSLLCPADLEETAVNLFSRSTNNDKTFIQSLVLDILPVWYWTDTTDWALVADPMECPTIEIGFLDGAEEPDIFVQDSPTSGSLFSHDQITYKIRHIYGGGVLDYRGMFKAVVAG
jgi:hypothetical protein